jgi:ubiquinone/menaquinone biosynthesis C-methylase UbiE
MPDEAAGAGREHIEPALVAGYDRKSSFDPGPEVALLLELGLDAESTLLDLGAGTGTFALAVAPHCRSVIAVDVSTAMVARMREKVAAQGATNVECVQAGLLGYEHRGQPVDVVYCRNTLHHLPDFWKAIALRRTWLMLRPTGILRLRDIVFSFDPGEFERFLQEWLDKAAERPEDGWTRAELEAHLRDEHSTFGWLLEPMLARAGFAIEAATYGRERTFADYVCVKAS